MGTWRPGRDRSTDRQPREPERQRQQQGRRVKCVTSSMARLEELPVAGVRVLQVGQRDAHDVWVLEANEVMPCQLDAVDEVVVAAASGQHALVVSGYE